MTNEELITRLRNRANWDTRTNDMNGDTKLYSFMAAMDASDHIDWMAADALEAALTEGRSNDDLLATARADRQTLWDEVRALRELLSSIKWKSIDKDNMEFEARATCYFMDKVRNAVSGKQDKT